MTKHTACPAAQYHGCLAKILILRFTPGVGFIPGIHPFHYISAHIIYAIVTLVCFEASNRHCGSLSEVSLIVIIFITPGIFIPVWASGGLFPLFFCGQSLACPCAVVTGVKPCYIGYRVVCFAVRIHSIYPRWRRCIACGSNKCLILHIGYFVLIYIKPFKEYFPHRLFIFIVFAFSFAERSEERRVGKEC